MGRWRNVIADIIANAFCGLPMMTNSTLCSLPKKSASTDDVTFDYDSVLGTASPSHV